jgi:hypothetical protein
MSRRPDAEQWLPPYFRQPADREPLGDTKGWFNGTGVDIKGAGYVLGPGAILARGNLVARVLL